MTDVDFGIFFGEREGRGTRKLLLYVGLNNMGLKLFISLLYYELLASLLKIKRQNLAKKKD